MKRSDTTIHAALRLTEAPVVPEPEASDATSDMPKPDVSSVQLLRSGTFQHPWYGTVEIDGELFAALVRNFDERVRGIDIALDIEHQPERGAAGWFRRLFANEDGSELWGEVEWTPGGRRLVEEGAYKYLSLEYDLAYTDEEGTAHGPTMLGAALTNRPFIKNMREATVNLSEHAEPPSEPEEAATTLREAALVEEVRRLREERDRLRATLRNERITQRLAEAKVAGKVTPTMEPWLRELAEREGDAALERVLDTLPVRVRFEEIGSASDGSVRIEGVAYADPISALDAAVQAKLRQLREEEPDREVTYAEALAAVGREHPALVQAYRDATRG